VLTNNRGVHGPKCEEFVAMALLLLANRIPEIRANQNARRWALTYSRSVVGQRVAVLGVGSMGGAAARAARRLWMDVVGVRRTGAPHPDVRRMYTPDRMEEAVADADFVVVSTPLTGATRGLIGSRELGWMKPGVNLINISRGGVVDVGALGPALDDGRVASALLDVFDREPLPPDAEEWDLPNTVVTPHCSSDDAESYIPRTLDLFLENLDRLLAGVPLHGCVDPALEY
jgi:phosphoglycerate dehydrogenase-like enzyme